jgi:hypothetical protein
MLTLGPIQTDNINQIITTTNQTTMGMQVMSDLGLCPTRGKDHLNLMITLSVITLSDFHLGNI